MTLRQPLCAYCGLSLNKRTPANPLGSTVIHKFGELPTLAGVSQVGWHGNCFEAEEAELKACFRERMNLDGSDPAWGKHLRTIHYRGPGRVVNSRKEVPQ